MIRFIAVACCLVPAASHIALAQGAEFEFRVAAGVVVPTGGAQGVGSDFSSSYGPGYSVGVGAGVTFASRFAVGVTLDYLRFALDEDGFLDGSAGSVSGGAQSILSLGVEARFAFGRATAPVTPYVTAGFAALKLSDVSYKTTSPNGFEEVTLSRDGLAQDVALHVGGGVAFRLGSASDVFVEIRPSLGAYDQVSYVPVRVGLTFGRM